MTTTEKILTSTVTECLERLTREALAMKRAGDMEHMVEQLWRALKDLEFDFVSCALLLMDDDKDLLTSYNIWERAWVTEKLWSQAAAQPLGSDLLLYLAQTSLKDAPVRYDSAVAAWREKSIGRHKLSETDIDDLLESNRQRFGNELPRDYVRSYLHVPFDDGVFTLRTNRTEADQFTSDQLDALTRIVEILARAYTRYREFLYLEQDRAIQEIRAEVQAMKSGTDIHGVLALLWKSLKRTGMEFVYLSISVDDPDGDFVHLYGVATPAVRLEEFLGAAKTPIPLPDAQDDAKLWYTTVPRDVWQKNHSDFEGVRFDAQKNRREDLERLSRLWMVNEVPEGSEADSLPHVAMATRIPQGRVYLLQLAEDEEDFRPGDFETLKSFGDALALGFTRYFDFQRLEAHNRRLDEERALERVRAEVFRMEKSEDINNVSITRRPHRTTRTRNGHSRRFAGRRRTCRGYPRGHGAGRQSLPSGDDRRLEAGRILPIHDRYAGSEGSNGRVLLPHIREERKP